MSKDKRNAIDAGYRLGSTHKDLAIEMVAIVATSLSMVSLIGVASAQTTTQNNVVRDSILLTGPRTIPAGDFIHVYDSTPYMIMSGHVAIKVPCDENNKTSIQVLTGQAPNLKPATMELIKELSKPGEQCLYHVDLMGGEGANGTSVVTTDVAIKNAGTTDVDLTDTSSVFVGVNEIMPGAEEGGEGGHSHAEMNMTGGSMEGMTG